MPDLPAWWLMTLFLCHPTAEPGSFGCGASTGAYLLWTTEAGCNSEALAYMATVKDVPVLRRQRHACFKPGMGTQP